jgi:hypothetical protein
MVLNEDQTYGFNLCLELYTKLLTDNKELLIGIVNMAYSQGIQAGIWYTQQQIVEAQEAQTQEAEVYEEEPEIPIESKPEIPKPEAPKISPHRLSDAEIQNIRKSPAEELIAKMKGVKR